MLPAAPVTTNDVVGAERLARGPSAGGGPRSATVQRSPSAWPTSTAPGSRSVSSTRMSASAAAAAVDGEVDRLDQGFGPLACEGLVKPVTAPPSGRRGARGVVAVAAAEAGGRHAGTCRGGSSRSRIVAARRLTRARERVAPVGGVELASGSSSSAAASTRRRPGRPSTSLDAAASRSRRRRARRRRRVSIGAADVAPSCRLATRDAGRGAAVERRAQHRHRHAAREASGVRAGRRRAAVRRVAGRRGGRTPRSAARARGRTRRRALSVG